MELAPMYLLTLILSTILVLCFLTYSGIPIRGAMWPTVLVLCFTLHSIIAALKCHLFRNRN